MHMKSTRYTHARTHTHTQQRETVRVDKAYGTLIARTNANPVLPNAPAKPHEGTSVSRRTGQHGIVNFCVECGIRVLPGAKYCFSCGTLVPHVLADEVATSQHAVATLPRERVPGGGTFLQRPANSAASHDIHSYMNAAAGGTPYHQHVQQQQQQSDRSLEPIAAKLPLDVQGVGESKVEDEGNAADQATSEQDHAGDPSHKDADTGSETAKAAHALRTPGANKLLVSGTSDARVAPEVDDTTGKGQTAAGAGEQSGLDGVLNQGDLDMGKPEEPSQEFWLAVKPFREFPVPSHHGSLFLLRFTSRSPRGTLNSWQTMSHAPSLKTNILTVEININLAPRMFALSLSLSHAWLVYVNKFR
jgi:hypothetical protein